MVPTRYIQRVNTIGGLTPMTGFAGPSDIKRRALVPYEADYIFYEETERVFRDK